MAARSRISFVDVKPLDILLHTPFGISGGAQAMANNVLVSVELDGEFVGYGEAAPLPPYNGETQAQALTALRMAQRWLVGEPVENWRVLAEQFRTRFGAACGSAQCAFEMALVDALNRRDGTPM